jgi:hypothetical protein
MASQEEIERQKELNKLQQENIRLKRADLDLSFSLVESLKEVLGINTKNTEYERTLLKINKDINKALVDRTSSFSTTRSISREISKNEDLITKSLNFQKGLAQSITISRKNGVQETLDEISKQKELVAEYDKLVNSIESGNKVEEQVLKLKEIEIGDQDALVDLLFEGLSGLERQFVLNKENRDVLKESTNELIKQRNQLGATGDILEILSAIPGLGGIARRVVEDLNQEISEGNKEITGTGALLKATFSKTFEIVTNGFVLISAITAKLVTNFLAINKSQTEFRRLTGESATNLNEINGSLITTNDQIKTLVSLTEQFGLNANIAFDAINIQEASELRELLGLSAEEANKLAFFAQASGANLKTSAENIYEGVDAAFSQKKLLQDIGNVSNSIAITFGGNLELMGKTANEAKRLGLNLEQVDKIAESLLNIESSIAKEFEAEVITGQQLNLERARFFALTNDLNGLTEELGKNQEIINSFATGTRIEQQSIAEAIGLSRDEISKMIFQQAIVNKLTTEEAAKKAGMTIEDAKRLTLQDSINKSIEKLTQALAGPLEALAALADNAFILYTTLGLIGTISLAKTIGSLITMSTTLATSAAFATATSAALTIGISAAAIIGAIALIGSAMASASKQAKDAARVQDGIAPSSKGPFTITDKFGAMAITTPGDSLMASPNINSPKSIINNNVVERRNVNATVTLTEQDIRRIANAVKEGAMEGTSKANVQAVISRGTVSQLSTRIQPELAVNTYRSAY